MTIDLTDYYGVTVGHATRAGARTWSCEGTVFRRDNSATVATVTGEGGARTSAEQDAVDKARAWARSNSRPSDWSRPQP